MTKAEVPETYKTFQKGQVIYKEGQVTPVAYMVKKGAVLLYRTVNNRKVVIAHLKPGQIFGEMGLIMGEPANATAEAQITTECIAFDRVFLQSLLLKSPNPIQRILRHLLEQLQAMHTLVKARPYEDVFLGICQLLELYAQAQGQADPEETRTALKNAVSYAEFCRMAKTVLQVQQNEIDAVLEKLNRVNLVNIRGVKGATYKRDILGQMNKSSEYLRDQIVVITDPMRFMTAARNLKKEMAEEDLTGSNTGMVYLDVEDAAKRAGIEKSVLLRLICQQEIPEGVFSFREKALEDWLENLENDYFTLEGGRWKSWRPMIADDLVGVDNTSLQLAFTNLGQDKLLVLYAAAGEAGKAKIRENVSSKTKTMLDNDVQGLRVDLSEVAAIEAELFALLEKLGKRA